MRSKIICHMASSIDGRLVVDRYSAPAAGIDESTLRQHYDRISEKFQGDGWVVGRQTMDEVIEDFPRKARVVNLTGENLRDTYLANRNGRDLAVCFDPKGKCHYGQDNAYGDHIVAVLGEQVPDEYLAELREDGVSYLFAGPDGHDIKRALEILGEAFGAKTLVLQGGGVINGAFLKAGLIDEISLLVYPSIDGLAGMPTIFEYVGSPNEEPAAGQSLRHIGTETLEGGMVWLRYLVEKEG
ncbi:MAG TPA: dihydrofolate reductase family protein [Chthoniobacterales bacterium]